MELLLRLEERELAGSLLRVGGRIMAESFLVLQTDSGLNAVYLGFDGEIVKINSQGPTGWGTEIATPFHTRSDAGALLEIEFGVGAVEIRAGREPLALLPIQAGSGLITSVWGVGGWQRPSLLKAPKALDFQRAWQSAFPTSAKGATALVAATQAVTAIGWALTRYDRVVSLIGDEVQRAQIAHYHNEALRLGKIAFVKTSPETPAQLQGIGAIGAVLTDGVDRELTTAALAGTAQKFSLAPMATAEAKDHEVWICFPHSTGDSPAWLRLSPAGFSRYAACWSDLTEKPKVLLVEQVKPAPATESADADGAAPGRARPVKQKSEKGAEA